MSESILPKGYITITTEVDPKEVEELRKQFYESIRKNVKFKKPIFENQAIIEKEVNKVWRPM